MDRLISVIVPFFNVAQYLSQCIESICAQTYRNLEILLIDDGSTDGCFEICEDYKMRDSRIKVLHKRNEGLVKARKDGIQMSTASLVTYVDGDDWIECDYIEKLYNDFVKYQADIVLCGRYEDTGTTSKERLHGIQEGYYDKDALHKYVYPKVIVNGGFFEWGIVPSMWGKLFRKEILEPFQMAVDDRLTMGEDAACFYPCVLNVNSIYVLSECLYHYRQTMDSMSRQWEDPYVERTRFHVLYETVNNSLYQYKGIYDLRNQWREHMLFIMVPRADALYKDFDKLDYLFPFSKVKKGSRIVIYGMGIYGQRLYRYLKRTGFCNLVAAFDRNYDQLQKQGIEVLHPNEISRFDYDEIVITCSYASTRKSIYADLIRKYPKENVHVMDEKLVKKNETLEAFGLLDEDW